jgi:hypothetical protein
MRARAAFREKLPVQFWHILLIAVASSFILNFFVKYHFNIALVLVSLAAGALITIFCGGATLSKRFISSVITGFLTAVIYTFLVLIRLHGELAGRVIISGIWWCFSFSILSIIGAVLAEILLPDVENP